ncbi:hypothetical protein [Acidibrevibacterium fodinaquatile]|uniref:hypothetical protein n=1 Tax=Acidibrevibacterium fodinaquatile TaxID=1969806 RepID=UPI0013B42F80|nr:hypothetical protein [Acidibrevibacterium fodinaquatile]
MIIKISASDEDDVDAITEWTVKIDEALMNDHRKDVAMPGTPTAACRGRPLFSQA